MVQFFEEMARLQDHFVKLYDRYGPNGKKTNEYKDLISEQFMRLKLPPRMFDHLIDRMRFHVAIIRDIERRIMAICVERAGMPRKEFIKSFQDNESDPEWLAGLLKRQTKWGRALRDYSDQIAEHQKPPGALREGAAGVDCRAARTQSLDVDR